jgi:hypothetical protein
VIHLLPNSNGTYESLYSAVTYDRTWRVHRTHTALQLCVGLVSVHLFQAVRRDEVLSHSKQGEREIRFTVPPICHDIVWCTWHIH